MVEEYTLIMKNDVWDSVPIPKGNLVGTYRYKIKHTRDGCIEKYKARFMARWFSQKERVDHEDYPCSSH